MHRTATRLAILFALVAVTAVGTGGYTTITAERTVSVATDRPPVVSVHACWPATDDSRVRLTVVNRYGRSVTVHVGPANESRTVRTVGLGERARITLPDDATTLSVRVTAPDLRVELPALDVERCDG